MSNVTPLRKSVTPASPATAAVTPMDVWLAWWKAWLDQVARATRWPLSGNVIQDIAPETYWFSPTVELNIAGDPRIEADVVRNVASYGKQLGILTEALLATAKDSDDPAVCRLRDLAKDIEARKDARRSDAVAAARRALDELQERNPDALKTLLTDYGGAKKPPR
jgi:hypothetical protein